MTLGRLLSLVTAIVIFGIVGVREFLQVGEEAIVPLAIFLSFFVMPLFLIWFGDGAEVVYQNDWGPWMTPSAGWLVKGLGWAFLFGYLALYCYFEYMDWYIRSG